MSAAFVSYAQNAEDVVLARAFRSDRGVYVDVGAASPTSHSVTKVFYDRGWHGMNIDPLPQWLVELEAERPRDINLGVGVSDADGSLDLFDVSEYGAGESTFAPALAARLEGAGKLSVVVSVPVRTLASLLDEHDLGPIDFLKIDVEGWELQVIRGNDWTRYRPRVVVVEATEPDTTIPAHQSWEPLLLDAGYQLCLFDGLNRFYAQAGESELIARLSVPASVLDRFELAVVVQLRDQVKAARAQADGAEARAAFLQSEMQRLESAMRATSEVVHHAVTRADDADTQFRAARLALEAAIHAS